MFYAKRCEYKKCREHLQDKTLIRLHHVVPREGRVNQAVEDQNAEPEIVTGAQSEFTPTQNGQDDKANSSTQIENDMHLVERAEGLYPEEFVEGDKDAQPRPG